MKIEKLQNSAKWLRRLVWAFILLVVGAYLVARLGVDAGPHLEVRDHALRDHWSFKAATDVTIAMFVIALVNLAGVVRRIEAGELFGPSVTRALRRFAFWLLLSSAASIVGPTLAEIAVADNRDDTVRIVTDLRDLFFLIAGLVLYLVAAVMDRAAAIDAELREIV